MKNIGVFVSENFQFLEVKFSIYLNRRVFVMNCFLLRVEPSSKELSVHESNSKVTSKQG